MGVNWRSIAGSGLSALTSFVSQVHMDSLPRRTFPVRTDSLYSSNIHHVVRGRLMADIIVSANISVRNGPAFPVTRTISVEAYEVIGVTIPSNTTDKSVAVVPGGSAGISFLAVFADWYGNELSYKIDSDTDVRKLDQPHIFTGAGAASYLGATPSTLKFSNSTNGVTAKDAVIQILVGRDATP